MVVLNNIEYKTVKGLEVYAASMCGKIIRISTGKFMKQYPTGRNGYLGFRTCVDNKSGTEFVHKAVANAWLYNDDPLNKIQVNHKDGNKLNNCVDNLEWVTRSQNLRHAINTGLKGKGSVLYNAELSEDQVHEICKLLMDRLRIKDIADRYDISKDIVRKIRAGDTYFHIRQLYDIPHNYKTTLSESTIKWVCQMINKGHSDSEIAKLSTNPLVTIIECKRIRYGIRYKTVTDSLLI